MRKETLKEQSFKVSLGLIAVNDQKRPPRNKTCAGAKSSFMFGSDAFLSLSESSLLASIQRSRCRSGECVFIMLCVKQEAQYHTPQCPDRLFLNKKRTAGTGFCDFITE